MIPIPKGSNEDTSDIKNYRGIALSSLLSKVFDSCIISLNSMVLRSDDLQFAYKKSCSTMQCVSMVTEVRWNNTVTDYFTVSNGVKQGVANIVQFVLGPTHITAQTYWYGLSYEWFIHGSIYIC